MTQSFQDYPWGPEGFPDGLTVKNLPAMQELQDMQVQSLVQEDPPEKEMTIHFGILPWEFPQTEPGGLQSLSDMTSWHLPTTILLNHSLFILKVVLILVIIIW